MSQERIGNLGYCAFALEATPGAAATPIDYTLLMDETMTTNYNLQKQDPAYGSKAGTYAVIPGLRDHKGDVTIIAEPNTALYLFDSFLTRGSNSGSNPTTWNFNHSGNSKTYTMDVSLNNMVKRFFGCQTSKITPSWNKNELQLKAAMSALGSFQGALLTSVTGTGPYVANFDTTYSASPTAGLVAGDLVRFYHPTNGTVIDAVILSLTATSVTTTTNISSMVSGDIMHLRPATVALNNLQTFLWSNTHFLYGATAATATTELRAEQGSTWELDHSFESDNGSPRSGSADPASLVRTVVDGALTIKKYHDTPEDLIAFNQQTKSAWVINHYAGANNQYNLQITFNHVKTDNPMPNLKPKAVNYSNIKFQVQNDQTDGVMFGVKVINALSTIS